MPELPEVETTRLALEPYLVGQPVADLKIRRRDLRWPIPSGLEKQIQGKQILALRRIGKYMLFDVEDGHSLIVHLGMSGSFRIAKKTPKTLKKHDHILITMKSGVTAIYHDQRRFGFLLSCPTRDLPRHPLLAKMAPDPLNPKAFTPTYLYAALKSRKSAVKLAIMDQHIIAGMGNIYASEALFLAKIHPSRPANSITLKEAKTLTSAVSKVLRSALASGGSTLRDYVSGENVSGYFQHHFAVYDREKQPCPHCHHPLQKQAMSGRATYFCNYCQH